jgi:hypothetical protein
MVKGLYGGECVELHHVYITDRGGKNRVAELVDVSEVKWSRLRDDVSEATVVVRGAACSNQAEILANIEPKRSEMVIYRGDERVWEGPVNRVGWHADWVEINARDVFDYLNGRPLSKEWDNSYPNTTTVTARLQTIISYELQNTFTYRADNGDPVVIPAWEHLNPPANVLPYVTIHSFPNEARTSAQTTPFQMTVGEHIDNFARTGGIDYTVVGRALHIWDVSRFLGQTRVLTEADFFGEVIITAYGADHASVAFTVADDGRYGGSGGVATDWKFLQKSGPAGTQMALVGATPRRPSVVDSMQDAWQGYRYWMAYQPTSAATMRIAASKNGTTWVDTAEADIDADATAGVTASAGNFPALAFAYDERLWIFFIGTNGHLYRTRTEDGKDFTVQIDLYTPAGGVTLASPSLSYSPVSNRWTFFGINTTTSQLVYMTSTTNVLDGPGQWGALSVASVPGLSGMSSVTMQSIGGKWVGMVQATGGQFIIESNTGLASSGFVATPATVIPPAAAGKHDTLGRAAWVQQVDGHMDVWYGGSLAGASKIFRTSLTGPSPDIGTGDPYMDYYGPWSKVFTVYDEDDTASPTQADLNSQAKRNLSGRSPVPIEVRIPDNSGIRLSPGLEIDDLVPGTHMPLLATLNSRRVAQMQKLHQMTVTETPEGETIQVTLLPATKEDADEEEGGD